MQDHGEAREKEANGDDKDKLPKKIRRTSQGVRSKDDLMKKVREVSMENLDIRRKLKEARSAGEQARAEALELLKENERLTSQNHLLVEENDRLAAANRLVTEENERVRGDAARASAYASLVAAALDGRAERALAVASGDDTSEGP